MHTQIASELLRIFALEGKIEYGGSDVDAAAK
jgi:hypothetical protein